ncbi:MAG: SDR family NAD(P)-dependent oxidoreductase [Alphaproteobacteria bacterium]|jgi:3-oxoacyl-[acyl-carrier protein] reductase|nr:SDR family NAD(P)-dependent oxidoreductase [Alphaproteobacteria bacterium]
MSTSKAAPLAGRVAIVTGGARNIGRAIALALAEDGADVVVNAREDRAAAEAVAAEVTAAGNRALAHVADVTDEAAVRAMIEATVATFGRIDILVSNAAVRRQQPFLEISLADWHAILAVPLDGAFLCAQACVPEMIRAGGGAIVTLGGISAHLGTPGRAHVCAAKAGLEGLTHALAMELAEHEIRVNCVAPGAIDTLRGASAGARPGSIDLSHIPARRMGRPEEIAAMVRHLCRPEGAYITGQTIHVNGGLFLV